MTLEEFDRLPDDGLKHELNEGELVTMTLPMPRHNQVVQNIYDCLRAFLREHPFGKLWFPDTPFVLSLPGEPTTLRGPDLAHMPNERAAQIDHIAGFRGPPSSRSRRPMSGKAPGQSIHCPGA